MTMALCNAAITSVECQFGIGSVAMHRPSRSQGRRAKSQRTALRAPCEAQCAPSLQPPRAGSCGPKYTGSARSRGPHGRSRDSRYSACNSYRAMIMNGKHTPCGREPGTVMEAAPHMEQEEQKTASPEPQPTFKYQPSVGSWMVAKGKRQDRSARMQAREQTCISEALDSVKDVATKPAASDFDVVKLRVRACDMLIQASIDGSLHSALGEIMRDTKREQDDTVREASDFVASLLQEAVEDYSSEKAFEILHKHDAPRVYDVPEPPILEEDENTIAEDDAEDAELTSKKLAMWEAQMGYDSGLPTASFDDCEEIVSVVSCDDRMEETQEVRDMVELAQEIVGTGDEECRKLPQALMLPPCTRRAFVRKLQPSSDEAPIPEEPFPLDCLPPSITVAASTVPGSEEASHHFSALEASERYCRGLATTTLQHLYMQASKTLASSLLPKTPVPKRAEKGINITEMRLKMQNAFCDAVKDGRLEKALSEGKETPPASAEKHIAFYRGSDWYHQHIENPGKKEAPKPASVDAAALEKARAKARNALVSAIQHGRLEMAVTEVVQEKKEMAFSTARDKLRDALVDAMEDGRLEGALRQTQYERARTRARDSLAEAALAGRLEAAILQVTQEKQAKQDMLLRAPAPSTERPSLAPAPPAGASPLHRRFSGARTMVAASVATPVEAPSPQPMAPSAPRPPATPSCGSPRKARLSATTIPVAPTPTPPTSRPTTSRPGARPTNMLFASVEASAEQPSMPMTPKVPVEPVGERRGGRRPVRASTLGASCSEPLDQTPANQACEDVIPPPAVPSGPMVPIRRPSRADTQVCLDARGIGPTALELDLDLPAGSMSASTGGHMSPRSMTEAETSRISKHAVQGTGLLPSLPSDPNAAGSVAWTLGLQHGRMNQKAGTVFKADDPEAF